MKKYCLALLALAYISCGSPENAHTHDDHEHTAHEHEHEGHDHEHEGHDHDHEGHDHEHEGHDHEHGSETKVHSDEVIFTKEQASMGDFALEKVTKGPFKPVIKTGGQVISSPAGQSAVTAPASGTVLLDGNLSEGMIVRAGAPLLRISSAKMADGDSFARAKADYEYAKSQWERAGKLIGERIISQKEYEDTRLAYQTARLAYEALSGSEKGGVVVKAPFTGYVKDLKAAHGSFAEKGAPLLTLVKSSRARLTADVPQEYFSRLPEVVSAVFSASDGRVYDTEKLDGRVVSYSKSVTPAGMLTLTMEYDGTADIPEGAFVEVALRLSDEKETVTVPLGAIIEEQGSYFVYVQLDEEGYMKRPVTIGHNDGIRAEVISGLQAGETIVSAGAYRVKLATASAAIPHSHEH